MKHYDVIVIGSGGGSKITRPAANMGYKVAIIEKGHLGGTCLNHGCIPSKMLIHPADIVSFIHDAKRFDITVDTNSIDVNFEKLVSRVTETISKDSESIAPMYEKHPNIDFYAGEARFIENTKVSVNDEVLSADKIFIATGARANIPNIEGLEGTPYFTYKEALRNTKRPKKMVVLGGGYIAVELGYFYAMMGTDVTFVVRSGMVRGEDTAVQEEFTRSFTKRFKVHLETSTEKVAYENNEFQVTITDKNGQSQVLEADSLFVATGVRPNSDNLGLENTDITVKEDGYIQVDDCLQTTVPNVYAFGDVIGRYLFRHTANFEGEYLFNAVFQEFFPTPIVYPPVPHAIFSNPQVGGVGMREDDLKEAGIPYVVGLNPYKSSAMGMALLSDEGFVKLLFHRDTQKLLGAHIIGEEASNMVHMLIAYMKMGAGIQDLLSTIYIHPALPEIVRNAARKAWATFNQNG